MELGLELGLGLGLAGGTGRGGGGRWLGKAQHHTRARSMPRGLEHRGHGSGHGVRAEHRGALPPSRGRACAACVAGVAGGTRPFVCAVRQRGADGLPGHDAVCRPGPHRPNADGGHVLAAPRKRLRCSGRRAVRVQHAVEQPTLVGQNDVRGEERSWVALDDGARRVRQKQRLELEEHARVWPVRGARHCARALGEGALLARGGTGPKRAHGPRQMQHRQKNA